MKLVMLIQFVRMSMLLNAYPYRRAGFLLAEKAGLVWKYAGKAFNKM
jgi:hypothetical protein